MQLLAPLLATIFALAGSGSATNFTGDVLNGVPVISYLDLANVPARSVSRYYLRVGELSGGTPLHLPVFVARGTPESLGSGKRLSLSAAIHGDELNGVRVVQRIFKQLEGQVATLNGTGKRTEWKGYRWILTPSSHRDTHCEPHGHIPEPAQLLHVWELGLLHKRQPRVSRYSSC